MGVESLAKRQRNPLDTPMLRQYLEIKASAPDCILFFRMGDFYEMFLEDAQTAAPILGLQLTSRNKGNPDEVPLCGFPHLALADYLEKMVKSGFKVAICEQVEAGGEECKIFRREIVRIVTPGLLTPALLDESDKENSRSRYLAAIGFPHQPKRIQFGLSWLDLATGEFRVTEVRGQEAVAKLKDEISRLAPQEVLVAETSSVAADEVRTFLDWLRECGMTVTKREGEAFARHDPEKYLCEGLGTQSLDGFGLGDFQEGLRAACAIVQYVQETQRGGVSHLCSLRRYVLEDTVLMDAATRRNLEIERNTYDFTRKDSLVGTMDVCLTRQGSRLLCEWLSAPLLQKQPIEARLDAVSALYTGFVEGQAGIAALANLLRNVQDLERICSRISLGIVTPRECVALGQSVGGSPHLCKALTSWKVSLLERIALQLGDPLLEEIAAHIQRTLNDDPPHQVTDGGIIREGVSRELDGLRILMRNTKVVIAEIEERERQKTGIANLKIRYNRVFGYYIEVTKSNLGQVPDYFIRKQTLTNAERYIVPELKELEEKLLHAEEESLRMERQIFERLREDLKAKIATLLRTSHEIATLDVLLAFARNAFEWSYARPRLEEEPMIRLRESRHPVLERIVKSRQGSRFVPNDLDLDCEKRQMLVITGPNMAGKSTIMRQLAHVVILAQSGSFVPAQEAVIGLTDGIFTRVGASDRLSAGQSTFMVEMNETANILHHATKRSIVILDEIGRGTSTFDGLSIAWSVAEFLHDALGCRTLFATHYHELADLPKTLARVVNSNIAVKEWNEQIVFLYKLVSGATNRSYGIQVAKLAGIPEPVLKRAKEILAQLEGSHFEGKGAATRQIRMF